MYTDNKKNGRLAAVLLIAVLFVCVALPVGAQDAALPNFTIADDTLSVEADQAPAVDSAAFAYQPEWYVAPVIPAAKRAPKRATMAADCPTDSVLTYNVDSVLSGRANLTANVSVRSRRSMALTPTERK